MGAPVSWEEPLQPHDPLIRSYKLCERWRRTVKKNPEARLEMAKFEQSEVMGKVRWRDVYKLTKVNKKKFFQKSKIE